MATFTVTTTSDLVDPNDGQLSLREASALADADPTTADIIDFAPEVQGERIVLSGSQLTVGSDVTIDGGAGVTIDANQQSRVLLLQSTGAEVYLRHLTITGGRTSAERDFGAGVLASGYVSLTLDHSTVRNNVTEGAYASGGGIFTSRTRFSVGGPLLLVDTTVSNNRTLGDHALGGGIYSYNVTLTDSTVSSNSTTGKYASGGGIAVGTVFGQQSLTIISSTVAGNSTVGEFAFGGGVSSGYSTTISNSIIAGNEVGGSVPDVAGGIRASNGLNVFGSTVAGAAPGDTQNVPASLLFAGGLGNNGGMTETIALRDAPDNPAIGRADPNLVSTTDQRDEARPAPEGTHPDIGAFELAQSFAVPPPIATNFVVTTRNDVVDPSDGQLSLREALALADADSSTADRVAFAPDIQGDTILLTGGQLVANSDVTIDGGLGVTIDAEQASRVLRVQGFGTDVVLSHLTLTGGHTSDDREGGGGVFADLHATLTLEHTLVTGNTTAGDRADGGGILAYSVTMAESTISDNSTTGFAYGGGIAGRGTESVALINSTINGNHASGSGGGIWGGVIALTASTVSGNTCQGLGGGIYAAGPVTLTSSTVSDNLGAGIQTFRYKVSLSDSTVSGNIGGGIAGGEVTLTNSTIAENTNGSGISGLQITLVSCTVTANRTPGDGGGINALSSLGPDTVIMNSIIAGNHAGGHSPDFAGPVVTSNGHNIFGSHVHGAAASDLQDATTSLLFADGLSDHGGATQTIALRNAPDNPALGSAEPADSPATDQRGEVRPLPLGTAPDIGAYESAWMASPPAKPFDGLEYIASYDDLIRAFGPNEAAGTAHYVRYGQSEGRTAGFDGLAYIASYGDLIRQLGADRDIGANHFISYGYAEGRTVTFHPLDYIASYADLMAVFGANPMAGSSHFITYGADEGRHVGFDGLEYIASYDDLITALGADRDAGSTHFIAYGAAEVRQVTFDGLQYIASYGDLIQTLGVNADAGAAHFIRHGEAEGRVRDQFDAEQYLENYSDLQAAFGHDTEAATVHYIKHGYEEGRTDQPLHAHVATDFLL